MSSTIINPLCPNATVQVRAAGLAKNIAGPVVHLRAVANLLKDVQEDFVDVLKIVRDHDVEAWPKQRETGTKKLARGVVLLQNLLDSIAILDNDLRPQDQRYRWHEVLFNTKHLHVEPARRLQVFLLNQFSRGKPSDDFFVDFWAVGNFWKHYYPHAPELSEFEHHRDFALRVVTPYHSGCTGPILKDLILPAIRTCFALVHIYSGQCNVPDDDFAVPSLEIGL
jgi:hypothetical protein